MPRNKKGTCRWVTCGMPAGRLQNFWCWKKKLRLRRLRSCGGGFRAHNVDQVTLPRANLEGLALPRSRNERYRRHQRKIVHHRDPGLSVLVNLLAPRVQPRRTMKIHVHQCAVGKLQRFQRQVKSPGLPPVACRVHFRDLAVERGYLRREEPLHLLRDGGPA